MVDDENFDDESSYQEWDSSSRDEYGDDDEHLSDYIYPKEEEW